MGGRVNQGRHVIIENETHAKLKEMCNGAGVLLTTICDTALRVFVAEMSQMDATEKNKLLQEMAGGAAFAKAFAPFAALIKLAEVTDKTGGRETDVAPKGNEGPAQDGTQ